MREIQKEKLETIQGGISITGTLINAFARGIEVLLDLGRSLGSAFRRAKDNNLCPY